MTIIIQRSAFFEAIQKHNPSSTAVINHDSGAAFSYGTLLGDVARAKERLLQTVDRDDISGERIAFLVENGYSYVVTLLSAFACNAIAVPLAPSFPTVELRHVINNSGAIVLLASSRYAAQAKEVLKEDIGVPVCLSGIPDFQEVDSWIKKVLFLTAGVALEVDAERRSNEEFEVRLAELSGRSAGGMMLFTSGTTARPKGVMLSDSILTARTQSLVSAWQYRPSDHLLHILPLHHIHGTVNALLTPLLAGSSIEFLYPFDANAIWKRISSPFLYQDDTTAQKTKNTKTTPVSIFTAVPTVWARMLQSFAKLSTELQSAGKEAISRKNLRLNMSGSAALPKSIREDWTALSGGNVLLERYGMTEVGMALSCGLEDADRIESSVGWPLPSVEARLMEKDADGNETLIEIGEEIDPASEKERQGEIQFRGPTVFKEYWQNPAATEKEFTQDGWFKTGDIAIRRNVPGSGSTKSGSWASGPAYFIQGRQSADIIKTGGEKVSALEIEREILTLPQVNECAVVGLPSESWGQKVAAVVVLTEECGEDSWSLANMRRELKNRLVPYKIPQDLEIVPSIKRNAMGKVNKKELVPLVFGAPDKIRRRSINTQAAGSVSKTSVAR